MAEEQGQQLHQHLDWAEAEVLADTSPGVALARTTKEMVLFSVFSDHVFTNHEHANLTSNLCRLEELFYNFECWFKFKLQPAKHSNFTYL